MHTEILLKFAYEKYKTFNFSHFGINNSLMRKNNEILKIHIITGLLRFQNTLTTNF